MAYLPLSVTKSLSLAKNATGEFTITAEEHASYKYWRLASPDSRIFVLATEAGSVDVADTTGFVVMAGEIIKNLEFRESEFRLSVLNSNESAANIFLYPAG